jgi:hypothetical protein
MNFIHNAVFNNIKITISDMIYVTEKLLNDFSWNIGK